jgi:hypothetical protein
VAHCEGIVVSLVSENAQPVDGAPEMDRSDVYRRDPDRPYPSREVLREDEADKTIAERVRDNAVTYAAVRSPEQLRTSFQFAVDGALPALSRIPGDRVVRRGGRLVNLPRMTFCELVASRHIEFGVHTMDIAAAVGRPEAIRPESAAIITGILDAMLGQTVPGALGWDSTRYILTGSGRRELEPSEREILGPLASRFPLFR